MCYAYQLDATNPMVQSGRPRSIHAGLERRFGSLVDAFPLQDSTKRLFLPLQAWGKATGQIYRPDREPLVLRRMAQRVEAVLAQTPCDVVFSAGSEAICDVRTDVPMVFVADAPFGAMRGFYQDFTNMLPRYERLGMSADTQALDRCMAAVYPSQWAANAAIAHHGADPAQTHVLQFGANVDDPGHQAVSAMIDKRMQDPVCNILFVGRDWTRKGADLVLDAAQLLRRDGLEVHIEFMGITDPPVDLPSWARCWMADRNHPDQAQARLRAFEQASLVFTPSRAEAFGMTFCEAACFGLPSISTDVGGISSIIVDGETGALEPLKAPAERYALRIGEIMSDHNRYRAHAVAARQRYEQRLNWDVFCDGLARIITTAAGRASSD